MSGIASRPSPSRFYPAACYGRDVTRGSCRVRCTGGQVAPGYAPPGVNQQSPDDGPALGDPERCDSLGYYAVILRASVVISQPETVGASSRLPVKRHRVTWSRRAGLAQSGIDDETFFARTRFRRWP